MRGERSPRMAFPGHGLLAEDRLLVQLRSAVKSPLYRFESRCPSCGRGAVSWARPLAAGQLPGGLPMTENRDLKTWSLAALGAAAMLPLAVACAGANGQTSSTAPTASVGMGQAPPPGYAYPGTAPAGYPGAQPGYPPAQQGYPGAQ